MHERAPKRFPGLAALSLAIACSGGIAAQGAYVSPDHFRRAEGNFGLARGLGTGAHRNRFLQLIEMDGKVRTITAIDLRRDADATGIYPSFALIADMYVSTASKSFPTHNTAFDDNHGADKVQVADLAVFVFPETRPGQIPSPWVYSLPFETSFSYKGKKPLCWEVQTHYTTSARPIIFDAAGNWEDNPQPVTASIGMGCIATGESAPATLVGGGTANWPKTVNLQWNASKLPLLSQGVLGIGSSTASWSGLVLPLMIPGTQFTPSGPCTFYNDFALSVPILSDVAGAASFSAPGVSPAALGNGDSLFAQALVLDSRAPQGFVLSNTLEHHFIRPFSETLLISHSYANGSLPAIGSVVSWQGLVVRVR